MRNRILGAALAALFLLSAAGTARADIIDLGNGTRVPELKRATTTWGDVPGLADLRLSRGSKVDLAFNEVAIGRLKFDAARVVNIWSLAALENEDFNRGEINGEAGYWEEAADAFGRAAASLDGTAKQIALWKRMLALANSGDADLALQSAADLIAAFPKGFYVGPAQETRARLLADQGKNAEALDAIREVTSAHGMNARDHFSARVLELLLTKYLPAARQSEPEPWQASANAFRALIAEIAAHPGKDLAGIPRRHAERYLASSLHGAGRVDEARRLFRQLVVTADPKTDQDVLAGAYYGLGDLTYAEALRARDHAASGRERMIATLLMERATLHYLRVDLLYKDYAGQREQLGATQGVARALRLLFEWGGEKDCDLGHRAYHYFKRAYDMLRNGPARRFLASEARALKKRLNAICAVADPK